MPPDRNVLFSLPSAVGPMPASTARWRSTGGAFVESFGATDVLVTGSGTDNGDPFEVALRDDRYLPFDGAGGVSTWALELPAPLLPFVFMTICDAILHVRFMARGRSNRLAPRTTGDLFAMIFPTNGRPSSPGAGISASCCGSCISLPCCKRPGNCGSTR
jgi:hypothetical protein